MIKHGIICPIEYLNDFATKSNFHLVLPHLIEKYPKYKKFYKERSDQGDFILCDNSLFELGYSMEPSDLLKYAAAVNATEVATPEILGDAKGTYNAVMDFLDWKMFVKNKTKVIAVVQGNNSEEMLSNFGDLNDIDEIDALALPFILDYEIPEVSSGVKSLTLRRVLNRWDLINQIHNTIQNIKPTHLLGLSDAVELQKYQNNIYPWIRSNDSSSAFVHGYHLIRYTDKGLPGEKISKKVDFNGFDKIKLTNSQIDCINNNINKMLSWCQ